MIHDNIDLFGSFMLKKKRRGQEMSPAVRHGME
jgi:hypothetical protein